MIFYRQHSKTHLGFMNSNQKLIVPVISPKVKTTLSASVLNLIDNFRSYDRYDQQLLQQKKQMKKDKK